MKTNFRRRFDPNLARRKRLLYIVSIFVLGVFLFSLFRGSVLSIFNPLWRGENFVSRGVQTFFSTFRDKQALVRENMDLRERVATTDLLERSVRTLEETQEEMLELFGRERGASFVAAGVLVHPPKSPYDLLVVDVGEVDGVGVGDKVRAPEGGALGLVSQVGEQESKVLLYTNSGMETESFLERGDVPMTLLGLGGGVFKVDLPRDTEVEVGDKIFLPGILSELVAVVVEVRMEPTDRTKEVVARGVSNINSVRFVEIHK